MRKPLMLALMAMALLPAVCKAGSGFYFYPSSAAIVGDLYGDGSKLTGVSTSTFTPMYVSTVVYSTSTVYYTTSQSAPNACITGSTLTFTAVSGATYRLGYSGSIERTGTGGEVNMGFRIDGALIPPFTDTLLHPVSMEGDAGDEQPYWWSYVVGGLTPGPRSVCFMLYTVSGQATIPRYDVVRFYVERIL